MSSPLERARLAVLRELRNPTEWVSGERGMNDRESERLVNDLIAAVRRRDIELARGELLTDQTGDETDAAYNRGVTDAVTAIEQEK